MRNAGMELKEARKPCTFHHTLTEIPVMRALIAVCVCLMLCIPRSGYSQVPHNTLKITFVGNAGFLVASSKHKVLIDALYSGVAAAPQHVTEDIVNGNPPFDSVDAYLITHYHKDHCDPGLIYQCLTKDPTMILAASKPAFIFMNGDTYEFILRKKQFVELTPEVNHAVFKTIHGVPVKAFGLKHGAYYREGIDMNESMLNAGLLVDMDGINVFHSGDIKIDAFQSYLAAGNVWSDRIDVALLCYGLFESGESDLDYIVRTIHPKHIVVMHVPADQIEACAAKIDEMKTRFPHIDWLRHSLDSTTISVSTVGER
jgi:L-ascorbate metabolism protein UlaG (beta-lactamase superfamily)